MEKIRFGSVCSGIEAASVAWNPLGWQAAWLAEIEPFPSAVLAHHYPDAPNLGDMSALPDRIRSGEIEAPDLFCGGTPCQAFSVAGLRRSLDDARGNLSLTFCEIANAIDDVRDRLGKPASIVFWENVPGVLSTSDNAFGCFLAELAGEVCELKPAGGRWKNAGAVYGPKRAVAWRILDAQYFGVAQRRRRVFVVASAREGFDPAAVLFEFNGLRRDSPPSRETGKVAPTIPARSTGGGGLGTDFDCDGGLRAVGFDAYQHHGWRESETIGTLTANVSRGICGDPPLAAYGIQSTIIGRKPENGPQGTGICSDVSFTLTKTDQHGVAYGIPGNWIGRAPENGGNATEPMHDISPCLTGADRHGVTHVTHSLRGEGFDASEDGTGRGTPLVPVAQPMGAFFAGQGAKAGSIAYDEHVSPTLKASDSGTNRTPSAHIGMAVRRLTPVECERLQGFPDNYTAISWRGKPADQCPDGPRYKALGNSWAVPVVRWIGRRIQLAISIADKSSFAH